MPSRHERLDQAAALSKEKIASEKKKLTSTRSAQREEARKARDTRRYQVGTLCDQAGLLACEDALLALLLDLCRRITDSATPRVTLAACQAVIGRSSGTSGPGMAHPTDGVSPAC